MAHLKKKHIQKSRDLIIFTLLFAETYMKFRNALAQSVRSCFWSATGKFLQDKKPGWAIVH